MKIQLNLNEPAMGDIKICGVSSFNLDTIPPQESVDFSLDLFPRSCGVHVLSGLIIMDFVSNREIILRDMGEFLVEYD